MDKFVLGLLLGALIIVMIWAANKHLEDIDAYDKNYVISLEKRIDDLEKKKGLPQITILRGTVFTHDGEIIIRTPNQSKVQGSDSQ